LKQQQTDAGKEIVRHAVRKIIPPGQDS
jgi:hypothetical protein